MTHSDENSSLLVTIRKAISPTELAMQLGVSPASALRACRVGRVRAVKFGKQLLVPADEADRLLAEGCRQPPDSSTHPEAVEQRRRGQASVKSESAGAVSGKLTVRRDGAGRRL